MKESVEKVSMQDIAEAVGVAKSTVSFVLNGKEKDYRIGEETAQKIKDAAKKMNYRVNNVARSLRTGETRIIALIVADISDDFFGRLAYYLQEYAMERGYLITIFNTSEKESALHRIIESLSSVHPDGIIMVPVANSGFELIDSLQLDVPIVIVDRYFEKVNTSRVIIDNYHASSVAVEHLVELGCSKIAMLSYRDRLCHMTDRIRGYENVMKRMDAYDGDLICRVDYSKQEDVIADFFSKVFSGENRADGLFVATGGLADQAVMVLARLGYSIPSDLKIVSFDKSVYNLPNVFIPYIKQPIDSMCRCALDILISRIRDKSQELVDCRLNATLITQ